MYDQFDDTYASHQFKMLMESAYPTRREMEEAETREFEFVTELAIREIFAAEG